jgi:two-component system phosphate regulon sensor histidine kinase PhoR
VISGFIETLQTTAKNDKQAQETFLKIMADQAEYMSALIENLLSLSRIELSQDDTPTENVNINDVIKDVTEALSLKADKNNMKIVVNKFDKLPFIMGDKRQVQQLLQNLIDNALKYGVSSSDITVSVKLSNSIPPSKSYSVAEGKALAISVNNKGPKINPEDLARLTERFYRLQEHKNLNIKGTGLGLSIAKQIILRHRGNLTVTSTNYDGTTFTVYLPLK